MKSFFNLICEAFEDDAIARIKYMVDRLSKKFGINIGNIDIDLYDVGHYDSETYRYRNKRYTNLYVNNYSLEKLLNLISALDRNDYRSVDEYDFERFSTNNLSWLETDIRPLFIHIKSYLIRYILTSIIQNYDTYVEDEEKECKNFLLQNLDRIKLHQNINFEKIADLLDLIKIKKFPEAAKSAYYSIIDAQPEEIEDCIKFIFLDQLEFHKRINKADYRIPNKYIKRLKKILEENDGQCIDLLDYPNNLTHLNVSRDTVIGSDEDISSPEIVKTLNSDTLECFGKHAFEKILEILQTYNEYDYKNDEEYENHNNIIEIFKQYKFTSEDFGAYYPLILLKQHYPDKILEIVYKIIPATREKIREILTTEKNKNTGILKKEERYVLENLRTALLCVLESKKKKSNVKDFSSRIKWKDVKELEPIQNYYRLVNFECENCLGELDINKLLENIKQIPWTDNKLIKEVEKIKNIIYKT